MTADEPGPALARAAARAAVWSAAATRLGNGVRRARAAVLLLSIGGALAAALASQMPAGAAGATPLRTLFTALGVMLLAAATFLSHRLLGPGQTRAWLRARVASEALKREAFRHAAAARPYDDPAKADARLDAERARIEASLEDLLRETRDDAPAGSTPTARLDPGAWRQRRVRAQVEGFYRPRAEACLRASRRLRAAEMALALAATLITALAGVTGKVLPIGAVPFDLAALTAVATTIAGALTAHVQASRFDDLATSYLATALRLEDADAGFDAARDTPAAWSAYVNRVEDAIAAETASWMARWSRHG